MSRFETLRRLTDSQETWDLVVIGGGATGLGIAVDAANRGYRTALLEQGDFCESTSSKSTKLIHGGVRYLRSGEVGLVRESLRERGRLLRNARGIVEPLAFVVPAYRFYEPFFYGMGLTLYDILAGDLGIRSTGHLSGKETVQAVPNLNAEGLYGGTLYWDGQFDDARLAVAMARTADREGAAVVNRVRVTGLRKERGRITGVEGEDLVGGGTIQLKSRVVVNATGVFTDSIRRMDEPAAPEMIAPSQGIHLVLDRKFLGGEVGVMIPNTDDGRVLFAIPWKDRMLLGTTDTAGVKVEMNPRPLEAEVDYLIEHAGRYLAGKPARSDVRSAFAGLRPLVVPDRSAGKATSRISRSHSLTVSDAGLVTMAGGKWTTYRQMAEDAVDCAAEIGGLAPRPCATADLPLLSDESGDAGERYHPDLPCHAGDVRRAVEKEMALTLDDVLSRRTRCLLLDAAASAEIAPAVCGEMARLLGRDETWIAAELEAFSGIVASYSGPTSQRESEVEPEGS